MKQLHENTNSRHTELIIGQRLPEWALLEILKAERDYKAANQGNAAAQRWNVDMMMKTLDDMLKLREIASDICSAGSSKGNKQNIRSDGNRSAPKTVGATVASKIKCVLCNKMGHYGSDCRNYNTYKQRVHQLKANNRCTKCIKEGHNYEDCEKEVKCATCKSKKHHTVLCPKNLGQKQVSFQSDDTDEDEHRQSRAKSAPKEAATEKRVPYRRSSNNVVSPVIQALRTSKAADQKTFDIG